MHSGYVHCSVYTCGELRTTDMTDSTSSEFVLDKRAKYNTAEFYAASNEEPSGRYPQTVWQAPSTDPRVSVVFPSYACTKSLAEPSEGDTLTHSSTWCMEGLAPLYRYKD